MHHQNNRSIGRTFIDVMHAQTVNVIVGDVELTRLKIKALQLGKVGVWSA
jgi:hypothetical protein